SAQAPEATASLFDGWFPTSLVVRARPGEGPAPEAVRRAIREAAPAEPIGRVRRMADVRAASVGTSRLYATLLGFFAGAGVPLTAIGLYGVIAYGVARRTHEIGVRMALGARSADILKMMMAGGSRLAAAGIAFGTIGAWMLSRFLGGLLFGVEAGDA